MYFVNPYFTQNTESLYKDWSVLFRVTIAVFCEKEAQQSNCLLEEILIYLLMPFCLGRFLRVCYLNGCVSCPLLGRFLRVCYLNGCVSCPLLGRFLRVCYLNGCVSCPLLGRLHRAYYLDGLMGPTNWTVTWILLIGRWYWACTCTFTSIIL